MSGAANGIGKQNNKKKKGTTVSLSELLIGKQITPQVYQKQAPHEQYCMKEVLHGHAKHPDEYLFKGEHFGDDMKVQAKKKRKKKSADDESILSSSSTNTTETETETETPSSSSYAAPARPRSRSPPHSRATHDNDKWNVPKPKNNVGAGSSWRMPNSISSSSNAWHQRNVSLAPPPRPPSQYRPRSDNWDDDDRNYRL